MSNDQQRRYTAYHEAGHAAAQLHFGQTPALVTIDRKGRTLGFADHLDGDLDTEEGTRAMVINCYAGNEAEIRSGGPGLGSESDDNEACRLIRDFLSVGGNKEVVEKGLREETAKLVSDHWPLIERIAKELLEQTTLLADELDSIVQIYNGKETDRDLEKYRNSWVFQKHLESIKQRGLKRGPSLDE